jgi:hypothetical protein
MSRPFRLEAPEPYELDIHEACASALDKLLLPPAIWACYPAGAVQLQPISDGTPFPAWFETRLAGSPRRLLQYVRNRG